MLLKVISYTYFFQNNLINNLSKFFAFILKYYVYFYPTVFNLYLSNKYDNDKIFISQENLMTRLLTCIYVIFLTRNPNLIAAVSQETFIFENFLFIRVYKREH